MGEAATAFRSLVDQEGRFIKALTLCTVGGAAALLCLRWRRGRFDTLDRVLLRQTGLILLTAALLVCACLLISARSNPGWYGAQIWANFGIFFYQLLLMLLCLGYCLRRVAPLRMLAPLLLCYCLTELLNPTKAYVDTTPQLQRRYAISWVNVARAAAARGDSQATIAVPTRGWPLPADWFPKVLGHTLYVYGIVDRPISIETRIGAPDADMEASPGEGTKDAAAAAPRAR